MSEPFGAEGIFQTPEDRAREEAVARVLTTEWRCEVKHFAAMSPVDWFTVKEGRFTGILELKCRKNASTTYPTVFLSVAKWSNLTSGSDGLGVPAGFVVRFTDKILWINIAKVDASKNRVAGRNDRGAAHDREPVIDVPIEAMSVVCETPPECLI